MKFTIKHIIIISLCIIISIAIIYSLFYFLENTKESFTVNSIPGCKFSIQEY